MEDKASTVPARLTPTREADPHPASQCAAPGRDRLSGGDEPGVRVEGRRRGRVSDGRGDRCLRYKEEARPPSWNGPGLAWQLHDAGAQAACVLALRGPLGVAFVYAVVTLLIQPGGRGLGGPGVTGALGTSVLTSRGPDHTSGGAGK